MNMTKDYPPAAREAVRLLTRAGKPMSVAELALALSEALSKPMDETDTDTVLRFAERAGATRLVRLEQHWTDNLWTVGELL